MPCGTNGVQNSCRINGYVRPFKACYSRNCHYTTWISLGLWNVIGYIMMFHINEVTTAESVKMCRRLRKLRVPPNPGFTQSPNLVLLTISTSPSYRRRTCIMVVACGSGGSIPSWPESSCRDLFVWEQLFCESSKGAQKRKGLTSRELPGNFHLEVRKNLCGEVRETSGNLQIALHINSKSSSGEVAGELPGRWGKIWEVQGVSRSSGDFPQGHPKIISNGGEDIFKTTDTELDLRSELQNLSYLTRQVVCDLTSSHRPPPPLCQTHWATPSRGALLSRFWPFSANFGQKRPKIGLDLTFRRGFFHC